MNLKRFVALSLIVVGVFLVLILLVGLFVPEATLNRWGSGRMTTVPGGSTALPDTAQGSSASGGTGGANGSDSGGGQNAGGGSTSGGSGSGGTTSGGSGGTTSGGTTGSGGTTPAVSIASFAASPSSVSYNSGATLSWAASNATSCSISPAIGAVAANGSRSTGNLTSSTTYTLSCTGNGSASKTAAVSVGAAPASCGQAGGTCSAAEVATHNTQSNCWVIYGGYYYMLTKPNPANSSYPGGHPGGTSVFNSSTCGHDITAYLNGSQSTSGARHTHSSSAYSVLNTYRVGPVQ